LPEQRQQVSTEHQDRREGYNHQRDVVEFPRAVGDQSFRWQKLAAVPADQFGATFRRSGNAAIHAVLRRRQSSLEERALMNGNPRVPV
jgi:hypothetical protein